MDEYVFGDCMEEARYDLENKPIGTGLDMERVVLWDNINAHNTPYINYVINRRQSQNVIHVVNRPQYHLKLAPI